MSKDILFGTPNNGITCYVHSDDTFAIHHGRILLPTKKVGIVLGTHSKEIYTDLNTLEIPYFEEVDKIKEDIKLFTSDNEYVIIQDALDIFTNINPLIRRVQYALCFFRDLGISTSTKFILSLPKTYLQEVIDLTDTHIIVTQENQDYTCKIRNTRYFVTGKLENLGELG